MRSPSLPLRTRRHAGVALVLVLIAIVLITALIVGFLVRAGSEQAAASNYNAAITTSVLAGTTVNLVQSQISEATTTTASGAGAASLAWASQPGAVRTFDTTGNLKKIYRLYSANGLTATSAADLAADVPAEADWKGAPALWTDLNEPVSVTGLTDDAGQPLTSGGQGYNIYPILDPRDPASKSLAAPSYLDAKQDEYGDNWGFSFDATNVAGSSSANPVMPVRWMYVLRNGQIAAPDAGSGGRKVTVSAATAANPIVGRIAFWTDDETCKVNINTAAGSRSLRKYYGADAASFKPLMPLPAAWSTPHYRIFDERLLFSENQPVHGEYQRYPGHPATTDLFNIFNALGILGTDYPVSIASNTSPQPTPSSANTSFYSMLPRYNDGYSSQGGARNTTLTANAANKMAQKNDRLYTSLGEMLYGSYDTTSAVRKASGATRQQLESGKFFLTAHSRAPEVTLYGTPRVAMWPVDASTAKRTAFDQLLAFCATTGATGGTANASQNPYYFQRSDSNSPTNDYNIARNQSLFKYLQAETSQPIPGFGGTLSAKYSAVGLGGATENDQILTEMLDYIRSTNLEDHSYAAATAKNYAFTKGATVGQAMPLKVVRDAGASTTQGLGRYNVLSEIGIHIICTADGGDGTLLYKPPVLVSSVSTTIPTSPVVGSSENAAYASNLPVKQFLRDRNGNPAGIGPGSDTTIPFPANPTLVKDYATSDPGDGKQLAPFQKRLQAVLLMECANPMPGFDAMQAHYDNPPTPAFQLAVSGLSSFIIGDSAGRFPNRQSASLFTGTPMAASNGDGILPVMLYRYNTFQNTGGILGFRYPMSYYDYGKGNTYNGWSGVTRNTTTTALPYRFVSDPFTVSAAPGAGLGFGGSFTIKLQNSKGETIQTYNVTFPTPTGGQIPIPDLVQWGLTSSGYGAFTNYARDWWGFDNRFAWLLNNSVTGANTATPMLGQGCFIRSDAARPAVWNYLTSTAAIAVPTFAATTILPSDVVRTLVAKDGDYRLTAAKPVINAGGNGTDFDLGPGYDDFTKKLGNLFREQGASLSTAGTDVGGQLVAGAPYSVQYAPKFPTSPANPAAATDFAARQASYDFDASLPAIADGAHANKPDEGNDYVNGGSSPYYNGETQVTNDLNSYFTANRIISSPVMFGSLPTGVLENITWRTLLFRPHKGRPAYADPAGPRDYLYLDLFDMPVVEPYAISEPFSTAGKINMNYQIQPFSYITRNTGVRAVLASELIAQVPKAAAKMAPYAYSYYKEMPTATPQTGSPTLTYLPVNVSEKQGTLQQFTERFNNTGTFAAGLPTLFKSAAEICDVHLVPRGGDTWPDFAATWYANNGPYGLVADNARERPYASIYPRLTTKSNTYTVHYRVQALVSPHGTDAAAKVWDESASTIAGEYRGSTTIERFIDPTKPGIPDYTANPFGSTTPSLDTFYQWRVIANNRFAP